MWINRIAAALAVLSAYLHLTMNDAGIAIVAMAVLCLFCAVDLWRSPGNRTWVMVAASSAGMLLAHSSFPSGHHHTGHAASQPSMTAASAIAAAELALAAFVVFVRTRRVPAEFRPNRLQELR
ncbi:hypothetical protein HQ346_21540 [Rhodococcus sp. BP-252]|uniref:Uncharacterized protein n=1 Tax=Rhodococcoides kyotonense TaxID=398843 RepID=A0A177Y8A5_9NOCA|nr:MULTISPECIES: hypothetical protein [Rhodococcus]MBY6414284.1 hypothetical protein [Rhodococcus sp. BP-320]MBY6419063.1 hypothetical protein [Rhodococcus sp. BP-321]MBY6423751.1 hypothetical protein [Rhodococcus sp. BP-324]MBY6429097.1 hypothetical protein [Rhodococcus sp. BP-323]MBY6434103.1 hypothetical protein [Rhodococcus sp. BP-322]